MHSHRAGLVCISLMFLGLTEAAASAPVWLRIRSPHFQVVTDAGAKRGTEVAVRCEQMRAAFSMLMSRGVADDPAPLLIFALKSQQEVDIAAGPGKKLRHAGLFLPGSDESFILLDVSGSPWHTVYHEYAHELLHANTSASVQTWFEEGFAEYFSTLDTNGKSTEIGRVPSGELQFLRENGKLMRLSDLVRVNPASPAYNQNGPAQAAFYAQSWLLVHYLFDHQLINRAQSFFDMMASGAELDQAALKSFGLKTEKLEQQLLDYARGERFRYFSLPPVNESSVPTIEDVSPATAASLQLDVRWHARTEHSKDDALALASEYKTLLAEDPDNATARRGFGLVLLELGKHQESFNNLRRAVQLQPDDALNHYAMAMLLNAMEKEGVTNADAEFSSVQEAETCISLEPHFAVAYRLNAWGLEQAGQFDKAISMMRQAASLSPRMEGYQLDLADLELRRHDYGPALALLRQLKRSGDPEVVRRAEYFLSSDAREIPLSGN